MLLEDGDKNHLKEMAPVSANNIFCLSLTLFLNIYSLKEVNDHKDIHQDII